MRDFQKQVVYNWEKTLKHGNFVDFSRIQEYVNTIWEKEGLNYPPVVKMFPKHTKTREGDATRFELRFHGRGTSELTILHELAHSMTYSVNGETDNHGPVFVGVYMTLLEKYIDIPKFLLWYTAEQKGVKFDKFAKPTIIDKE